MRNKKVNLEILSFFLPMFFVFVSPGSGTAKDLSYKEMIKRTAQGEDNIHITIGIIHGNDYAYTVYGKNGIKESHSPLYEYEIGSISKTFTTSLLAKALSEHKISLKDSVAKYLNIQNGNHYPTIEQLATHTSGYGNISHWPMTLNAMKGKNPLMAFNRSELIKLVKDKKLSKEKHEWEYSNFGIAVLGCAVANSYNLGYDEAMEKFIKKDLKLKNTRLGNGKGNLGVYWDWKPGDVYIAAGGIISTIDDMMQYARIQMNEKKKYLSLAHKKHISVGPWEKNGVGIDGMGLGWIIDSKNNVIWHDGGTDNCNSFLGINRKKQIAVIVLINTPDDFRFSARDIGANLLNTLSSSN